MAGQEPPPGVHVTYSRQYRRCGNPGCPSCASGRPGHGPYWYASWREDGKPRIRYLGKHAPPESQSPTPLDVVASPRTAEAAALRVRTLGAFALWRGTEALSVPGRARGALRLFQCLLSAPQQRLHREQLIEALWPEVEPAAGAARLRRTLHALRRLLDGPRTTVSHVRWEGELLAVVPRPGEETPADWLDALAFERAAGSALAGRNADVCRAALARYGGAYLPEEPYAEWAVGRREALEQQWLALLLHLADLCRMQGETAEAERRLREALAADPCHEGAARALMELLAAWGRRGEALRVYQGLATALDRELGLRPQAALEGLRVRLLAEATTPVAADYAPRLRLPVRASNLPAPLSSFVGRHWERKEARALLGGARLLTLTGTGGCGKSRLAREVAGELLDQYPDGVWQVELAAVAEPTLVPQVVATVLGVVEQPGRPLVEALVAFLQPRVLLLLLDNCEHLLEACATLAATLLGVCPHLRILATSRQALGITGEIAWLVPTLAAPSAEAVLSPAELAGYEAVQLFVARARAHRPAFALSEANAGAVAQVCARLDGMPLALELAAARLGALSVAELAARLGDRLALLHGGNRAALPRHQTLRATLDWSWQLLGEAERVLLPRLAVFAGGWTPEAAQAVCGHDDLPTGKVLDLLAGVVAKSLVQVTEQDGQSRYGLLETIREYAVERLEPSNGAEAVRARHAGYFLGLAEEAAPELTGPNQAQWLVALEQEHGNLRAALAWAQRRGDGALGLRLVTALWRFWYTRGHLREGQNWLEVMLAHAEQDLADERVGLRARALFAASAFAALHPPFDQAEAFAQESLALCQATGDQQGVASALNTLGVVARRRGEYDRAMSMYERVLEIDRSIADRRGMGAALYNLGVIALKQGALERSLALFGESLTLRRALADRWGTALTLAGLGSAIRLSGRATEAGAALTESLALFRALGDPSGMAACLEELAWVAYHGREAERATRLWAVSVHLREQNGDPLSSDDQVAQDGALATLRATLEKEVFASTWPSGQAMSLEEAVALALVGHAEEVE